MSFRHRIRAKKSEAKQQAKEKVQQAKERVRQAKEEEQAKEESGKLIAINRGIKVSSEITEMLYEWGAFRYGRFPFWRNYKLSSKPKSDGYYWEVQDRLSGACVTIQLPNTEEHFRCYVEGETATANSVEGIKNLLVENALRLGGKHHTGMWFLFWWILVNVLGMAVAVLLSSLVPFANLIYNFEEREPAIFSDVSPYLTSFLQCGLGLLVVWTGQMVVAMQWKSLRGLVNYSWVFKSVLGLALGFFLFGMLQQIGFEIEYQGTVVTAVWGAILGAIIGTTQGSWESWYEWDQHQKDQDQDISKSSCWSSAGFGLLFLGSLGFLADKLLREYFEINIDILGGYPVTIVVVFVEIAFSMVIAMQGYEGVFVWMTTNAATFAIILTIGKIAGWYSIVEFRSWNSYVFVLERINSWDGYAFVLERIGIGAAIGLMYAFLTGPIIMLGLQHSWYLDQGNRI